MALNDNLKILQDSLEKARKYNEDKNYGRSFAHYLIVFQLLNPPESRQKYEKEFTNVLHIWGSILHNRKQFEDIFKCYNLATLYFPCSPDILNNLGVHALKLKNFKLAKTYFEKSLNNDREFLPAEQNLQTTKFMLVERWHFPMLNDIQRNKSYGQAIFTEITNGFKDILDVGTGTGILSLFASRSQQTRTIVACDYSETMCEIAAKVFRENDGFNIKLIKKSSMDLEVRHGNDLNKRATLLVTEILDSGVFGENILETLIHAWDNLLFAVPYAKIIPASVDIFITGIQSENLSRKVRLNRNNILLHLDEMCLAYLPIPYDTENLKHEPVSYVTDTQLALKVNFNDVQQLKQLLHKDNLLNIKLNPMKCGRVDAFVVWFKLYLNETISITNSPFSREDSCWEQAVFYLHHPLITQPTEQINIQMSCSKGYIDIIYNENEHHNCSLLPKNAILFLNDTTFMQYIQDICQFIKWRHFNNISVLDLTPFPVLALQLLADKTATKATCKVERNAQQVIHKLCELNSIDKRRIIFVDDYEFGDQKYDVIFQNFINPCGLLNEEEIYNSEILKYHLTDNGLYIPDDVQVYGQLVECDWLKKSTKVYDENCCGFKIAEFINEYKSTEQRDINLNLIPHTELTEPINLGQLSMKNIFNVTMTEKKCQIIGNGCGNAIFYWFKIKLIDGKYIDTRRNECFCNNASFILDTLNYNNYKINDEIKLVLKQHRGILKIYIEKY